MIVNLAVVSSSIARLAFTGSLTMSAIVAGATEMQPDSGLPPVGTTLTFI